MTSSPDDSLLEYAKRATEEYEQRKREQEALHKAARERFLEAATTIENGCSSAHINVAHLLTPLGQAMVGPDMDNLDPAPELYYGNGKAYISCCFWTDFGGLIREYAELTLAKGMLEDYFFTEEKTLFKYDCGICF